MSLKFFHVLFISASSLMALGIGLWAVQAWRADGSTGWLSLAAVALAGGGALVVYGRAFLRKARRLGIAGLVLAAALGLPQDALACPACVGTTDSALQSGMNMGVFVLLGVIGFMLVCFAWFFIHLARRAHQAAVPRTQEGSM